MSRNRKAISAVLTTIVILVASIVLGAGTVVYATSLFQTGGQQQSVQLFGLKTWVNATYASGVGGPGGGIGWGAFAIKNTGDKALFLSSIAVRGTSIPFTSWYADADQNRTLTNLQAQFVYGSNDQFGYIKGSVATGTISGGNPAACVNSGSNPSTQIVIQEVNLLHSPLCLVKQSGPIPLAPGSSVIVYYKLPTNLLVPTDSGLTTMVSILAGNTPFAQAVRITAP